MKKFDYMDEMIFNRLEAIELAKRGDEGWELVHIWEHNPDYPNAPMTYVYKRERAIRRKK